jgi:hypothetical protein
MENNVVSYLIDFFKEKSSYKKQINNQEIDHLLQTNLEVKPIGEGGIRALIHYIRMNITITNKDGDEGWIVGSSDGYYLTFDPIHILTHLDRFDGKIRKMMLIRNKGYALLDKKVYYKQQKLQF